MSRETFRKHILKSYLFQVCFLITAYLFYKFVQFQLPQVSSYFYVLIFAAINIAICSFVFDMNKYKARFKDIYPDQNLSTFLFAILSFIPITFLALTIFLYMKERVDQQPPPVIFRPRYYLLSLAILISVQVGIPHIAYMTASPSMYFIVETSWDTLRVIKLKDKLDHDTDVFQEYQDRFSKNLSSTEIVLLVALSSANILKDKESAIARAENKDEVRYEYRLRLLESLHKSLLISESNKANFVDFSPIQWLHPSGPFEILILTKVDNHIQEKFNRTVIEKSLSMLDSFNKSLGETKVERNERHIVKVKELRRKFERTKTFLAYNSK